MQATLLVATCCALHPSPKGLSLAHFRWHFGDIRVGVVVYLENFLRFQASFVGKNLERFSGVHRNT
jgi:hypothetical protein